MSVKNITVCDNCGTEKRQVNHWWRASAMTGEDSFIVIKRAESAGKGDVDLCGEQCVSAVTQRWMATGKLLDT